MRTSVGSKHVPAFLTKLWKLVEDPGCDDLISWSENGTSFVIHNDVQFAKELLPMYFKHNHMASFVRQLNMYGFRKLNHIEYGGMHYTSNEIEFFHQYFIKGQESLLKMIKRKVSNSKLSEALESKSGSMKDVALSIKNIKDHQQCTEKIVKDLKQQNAVLWKQLALVNERCVKQQRLLTELVPVFFGMVQPTPGLQNKRKAQLMIDDGLPAKKVAHISPQYLNKQKLYPYNSDSMPPSPFSISNSGPVIHDVTDMETKKMYAADILCSPEMPKDSEVFVHSPLSCKLENSERMLDCSFTDQEAMEPFNALNFRNNLSVTNEPIHEQPLRMVSSVPSPVVPYHIDVPDVKSPTADNFSSFNSLSAVGSPTSHSSPASLHSEVSCHSEFCNNEENIPAIKAVFESLSDQSSILSSSLMSDSCMNATAEVMPSTESFNVITNTCSSPLLLAPNVQAMTPVRSPVSSDQLNPFCESSVADSYAVAATCSPILPMNNNSHCAEGDKYKTVQDADARQSVLTNNNFSGTDRGGIDNTLNWLGNSDGATESNMENWLGQLLRSEGIITSDVDMSYNI